MSELKLRPLNSIHETGSRKQKAQLEDRKQCRYRMSKARRDSLMKIWARVKALFKRKQLERDLEDELAFHLAMREEKKRTEGVAAEEAKYAARRQFGNV